jgi:hypothetical protein
MPGNHDSSLTALWNIFGIGRNMRFPVPEYIETRIRQRQPDGLPVVPGSTPVVSFGDVRNAKVATLGLNPSRLEFLDRGGNELTETNRRLETLSSICENDLPSASPDAIRRVFEGCNNYFQRRPYRTWFGYLEEILHPLGASYYSGTACHLDLVQWATNPTWGNLRTTQRKKLVEADVSFLRQQLSLIGIRLLLLNGSGVVNAYSRSLGCEIADQDIPGIVGWKLFVGCNPQSVRVIGWNKNLQGSHGVTKEDRKVLGMAIEKARFDG